MQDVFGSGRQGISRRRFLRTSLVAAGAAGLWPLALATAPAHAQQSDDFCAPPPRPWLDPSYKMEAGPIINVGFGGSFSDQEFAAVWNPFTAVTGVHVKEVPSSEDMLKQVQAQQAVGHVEIDQVSMSRGEYTTFGDIYLPIDYSIFPAATLNTMDSIYKLPNAIGYASVPQVIAYSLTAFPDGGPQPQTCADVWDVQRFPGGRSFPNWPYKVLEAALLADGVPQMSLFPLDVERAFAKLDQIKPYVAKWWGSGTESQQLLVSGDATVIAMSNSRIENLIDQQLPFTYTLNQGLVHVDYLGVPKGAPHAKASMASIAFRFEPQIAANIGALWRQPIPATAVWSCADPGARARWTTNPDNAAIVIPNTYDNLWWWQPAEGDANGRSNWEVVSERYAQYIAS